MLFAIVPSKFDDAKRRADNMSKIRSLGYRPMGSILIPSASGKQSGRISTRVGDEIRQLRKRQGMTIVELSKCSQQSTGHLSQIERGVSVPSGAAIESIAAAFGVRVTWFFEAGEVSASSEGDVVGRAVLEVLERERLLENARATGQYLLEGLKQLHAKH